MKKCSRCHLEKPETEFYKRSGRDGVQAYCKECNKINRTELTNKNRKKGVELLGGKCVKCGYSRYHGALHFHHPDPSLKDDLFHRLRNRSWEHIRKVLIEQKCELLCANCHIEHHHGSSVL